MRGFTVLGLGIRRATTDAADALMLASTVTDQRRAIDALITLGRRSRSIDPWVVLARQLPQLSVAERDQVVIAGSERWVEVAQFLATSPESASRRAAAELAGESDNPEVILALGSAVCDAEEDVAAAAVRAISKLVHRATTGVGMPRRARAALAQIIADGLNRFDRHQRAELIGWALALLSTPAARCAAHERLIAWFTDQEAGDDVARRAIRSAIRRGTVPESRALAWQLLPLPVSRSACVDRLLAAEPESSTDNRPMPGYETMLRAGHLMANPDRATAWAHGVSSRQRQAIGAFGDERFIEPEDERAAMRVAGILGAAGSHTAWNAAIGLLADPRPSVRWSLVREVVERDGPWDVLLDAALDPDPRVASAAVRAGYTPLGRARLGRDVLARLTGTLSRSGHTDVRGLAQAVLASQQPWTVDDAGSRLLARRMLKSDREGFVVALRRRVLESALGLEVRIGALRMAERLGLGAAIESDLRTVVRRSALPGAADRADEQRVAATAVRVLGGAGTATGARAVLEATRHPDPRVRANATDALTRAARRGLPGSIGMSEAAEAVIEMKNDAHHRVRASAIRAEIVGALLAIAGQPSVSRPATMNLVRPMLTDARDAHRMAGLWLIERTVSECRGLPWEGVAGTVAAMVNADPSETVRVRARRCAAMLIGRTREGWSRTGALDAG